MHFFLCLFPLSEESSLGALMSVLTFHTLCPPRLKQPPVLRAPWTGGEHIPGKDKEGTHREARKNSGYKDSDAK